MTEKEEKLTSNENPITETEKIGVTESNDKNLNQNLNKEDPLIVNENEKINNEKTIDNSTTNTDRDNSIALNSNNKLSETDNKSSKTILEDTKITKDLESYQRSHKRRDDLSLFGFSIA